MALRTPVTLSAAERQDQLGQAAGKASPSASGEEPKATVSVADLRQRLNSPAPPSAEPARHSILAQRNPVGNASAGMRPGDDFEGAMMSLRPDEIDQYDDNPRTSVNPRFDELKASIKVQGILNTLTVTRRAPGERFFVYGGGNTRLQIAQELVREDPSHPLLSRLNVTFRKWKGEADCLIAHLVENDLRGDNAFWEKALGFVKLKLRFEREMGEGTILAANDLRTRAASKGWALARTTAALYLFSVEMLRPVGPWLRSASAASIKERFEALARLCGRFDPVGGRDQVASLLSEVLQERASILVSSSEASQLANPTDTEVDAPSLCAQLDEYVARALHCTPHGLQRMLSVLVNHPQASPTQLREAAGSSIEGTSEAVAHDQAVPEAPTQRILPTPMLAGLPAKPAASTADASDADESADSVGAFPALPPQGALPPELASPASEPAVAPTAETGPARSQRQKLLDAAVALAEATNVRDLIRVAQHMPLGYIMDLPMGDLGALESVKLPAHQQRQLRQGGWQILALLSGQLDVRFQVAQALPPSAWLSAAQAGQLPQALARCGVAIDIDGTTPKLDAGALFYIMTEPRVLGKKCRALLANLEASQAEMPNVLPVLLQLQPTPAAAAG